MKNALTAAVIFLLVTNIVTGVFLVYEKTKNPFENPYPLIDVSRNFIPQDDFVVNLQALRDSLSALVAEKGSDTISLYFEFLNTGANISINQGLKIWPASLPKVPLAMAVMKKVERGEWKMDSELVLAEDDKDMGYGGLWGKPLGSRFSIETLLTEILVRSDNTAYRMLLRNVEFKELMEVVNELGLEDLFTEEGLVSAKEYSRLFRALYVSSFLQRSNSEWLLTRLAQSDYREFLTAGMPQGITFSHKFGIDRDIHAYLDSGIAYAPGRPYLISVAVKGTGKVGEEEKIKAIMKEIAEQTYSYVVKK